MLLFHAVCSRSSELALHVSHHERLCELERRDAVSGLAQCSFKVPFKISVEGNDLPEETTPRPGNFLTLLAASASADLHESRR